MKSANSSSVQISCNWLDCAQSGFMTAGELSQHVTDEHLRSQPFKPSMLKLLQRIYPAKSIPDDLDGSMCLWEDCKSFGTRFSTFDELKFHFESSHLVKEAKVSEPIFKVRSRRSSLVKTRKSTKMIKPVLQYPNDAQKVKVVVNDKADLQLIDGTSTLHLNTDEHRREIFGATLPSASQAASLTTATSINSNLEDSSKLIKQYRRQMKEKIKQLFDIRNISQLGQITEHMNMASILSTNLGLFRLMPPHFTNDHLVHGDWYNLVNGRFYLGDNDAMYFVSELIGLHINPNTGKTRLKLRWTPENYLDDIWVDHTELDFHLVQLMPTQMAEKIKNCQLKK